MEDPAAVLSVESSRMFSGIISTQLAAGAAIAIFILFSGWLLSHLSGWRNLAARYPAVRPEATSAPLWWDPSRSWRRTRWGVTSLAMRWNLSYNLCVLWRADEMHLHLRLLPPLSMFHAPLSLPWQDMDVQQEGRFLVRIQIADMPLLLTRRVGAKLLQSAAQGNP